MAVEFTAGVESNCIRNISSGSSSSMSSNICSRSSMSILFISIYFFQNYASLFRRFLVFIVSQVSPNILNVNFQKFTENFGTAPHPVYEIVMLVSSLLSAREIRPAMETYLASITFTELPGRKFDSSSDAIQHTMLSFETIKNHFRAILAGLNMVIASLYLQPCPVAVKNKM